MIEKLPEVKVLGSGGAFDYQEGNSSFVITVEGRKILVDCGFTVYSRLRNWKGVDEIDAVCITHTHDDHIGSLSTFIYDRWFIHKKDTRIVATPSVLQAVSDYLAKTTGHLQAQIRFNSRGPNVISFPTDNLHVKGMPSCGFIFNTGGVNLIVTGDLGCPITKAITLHNYAPQNTVIFHDSTVHEGVDAHCHFSELKDLAAAYTVYAYHHSSAEEETIITGDDNLNVMTMYPY